jgi:WD40 repeat protein
MNDASRPTAAGPIRCPYCHGSIRLPEDHTAEVVCPGCGGSFRPQNDLLTTTTQEVRSLGRFQVLERVGAGAFGAVWRARDPELDRLVALKLLHPSLVASIADRERFQREARAAAQLRHPGIVTVHEITTVEGMPAIVSDFIDGVTLRDFLQVQCLKFRESAALVGEVADALDYAHGLGLVHRDVKPANIMIETGPGGGKGPDASAGAESEPTPPTGSATRLRPVLLDFGLALRGEFEVTMTVEGQVLGTPAYMSPEQAAGHGHRVDRRSDVYALGVVLYELLCGELPFRGNKGMLRLQVLQEEPRPPRRLNDQIPRDLETICLKAMAKEPARRYRTARDLAEDLRRFLRGEPIQARPVGLLERTWRWAKRRPAVAALLLVSGAAALTAVGGAVSLLDNVQLQAANRQTQRALKAEEEQRKLAQAARAKAELFQYVHHIALAHSGWRSGNLAGADKLLDDCPPERRCWEWNYLKRLFHTDLLTVAVADGETSDPDLGALAFSPDGTRLASADSTGTICIRSAMTGEPLLTLRGKQRTVSGVAFSPDGARLASAGPDKTLQLWNAATGQLLHTFEGHADLVNSVAFSPDGTRLASASTDNTVRIWEAETGREVRILRDHRHWVFSVAFSPDGTRLASASHDTTVKIWDVDTGRAILTLAAHTGLAGVVVFSPDGDRLASAGQDQIVKIWDVRTGREIFALRGHTSSINGLAFSPDGARLATASSDQSVRLWDAMTGQPADTFRGHTGPVTSVAFSPDGTRLASVGAGSVKIWPIAAAQEALVLRVHRDTVFRAVFSPDGTRLVSSSADRTVRVSDARTGQVIHLLKRHEDGVRNVAFNADGTHLATACHDSRVRHWNAADGRLLHTFKHHSQQVFGIAISPDGKRVASGGQDRTVVVCDSETGQVLHTLRGHDDWVWSVAFSPNGTRLASASADRTVKVWDTSSGQLLQTLASHKNWVRCVTFNLDGTRLATASRDGTVKIWDAATGNLVATLEHGVQVTTVAFHPDGNRLVTGGDDGVARVWDVPNGHEVLTLRGHTAGLYSAVFSPDGTRLVTAGIDQTVRIWDARPLAPEAAFEREALGLLDFLFAKPVAKAEIIAYLKSSSSIRPQARQTALALAECFKEEADAQKYYAAAWSVIRHPYSNVFMCQSALAQMNAACARAPNNEQYGIALGVARYRLGKFQKERYPEAQATMIKCDPNHPATLAFLAMTQYQLGEKEQASATLVRLCKIMGKPEWATSIDARAFLREAAELIEGKPAEPMP